MHTTEILNIDYHRRLLIWKALHRTDYIKDVPPLVGYSLRQVNRLIDKYGFEKDSIGWYQTKGPIIPIPQKNKQ